MKVIDEDLGGAGHIYEITQVGEILGRIVQLQVKRDAYAHQSFATARVLNDHTEWTDLVDRHSSRWWDATTPLRLDGNEDEIRAKLNPVLDKLEGSLTDVLSWLPAQQAA